MSISSAHITSFGVDLTRLAMHRGAHLMSASKLGIPQELVNLFYDTDSIALSEGIKDIAKVNIGAAKHVIDAAAQQIFGASNSGERGAFLA